MDDATTTTRRGESDADISTDDTEPRGAFQLPEGVTRGVCRVCGADAYKRSATYCDEHRELQPDRPPRARKEKPEPVDTAEPGKPRRRRATSTTKLQAELETQLQFAAQLWAIRDPDCAGALYNTAPNIAAFWADRAKANSSVARALGVVTSGGGWLGGIAVHMPLFMAIYAHHVAPAVAPPEEAGPFEASLPGDYGQPAPNGADRFGTVPEHGDPSFPPR